MTILFLIFFICRVSIFDFLFFKLRNALSNFYSYDEFFFGDSQKSNKKILKTYEIHGTVLSFLHPSFFNLLSAGVTDRQIEVVRDPLVSQSNRYTQSIPSIIQCKFDFGHVDFYEILKNRENEKTYITNFSCTVS